MSARVLIVEDEGIVARELEKRLTEMGHQVAGVVSSGEAAIQTALETRPELVFMDIRLEGKLDGIDAAQQINNRLDSAIIYLTAYADDSTVQRARQTNPYGYILKPFRERELAIMTEMVLNKHRQERQKRQRLVSSGGRRKNLSLQPAMMERLEELTGAMVAASGRLELNHTLQNIADAAREFAGASYAAMAIVDSQGQISSFITSGVSKEESARIGKLPIGHGLLGTLIKQGKVLRVRDINKDSRRSGFPAFHPNMNNLLGVPITSEDRLIGNLYLTNKLGAPEFSAEDEWWLSLFARQAAVAVENAQLYQRLQQAHHRLGTLVALTGTLNSSGEPEELFKQITHAAANLLDLPAAALFLLNTERNRFRLQAQTGLELATGQELWLSDVDNVLWQVLQSRRPVVLGQSFKRPEAERLRLPGLTKGKHAEASLSVPVVQDNQVTGVLVLYADQQRLFSNEEISLLETFAGQASLALEKAQMYRHKEDFLSMTAHDLRAPAAAIRLSAGLLEQSLPATIPPELAKLATNINRNSLRLQNLLDDLLEFNRLRHRRVQLRLEEVEFNEALANTSQTLTMLFEKKAQKLVLEKLETDCRIMADRRRLEQILVNLLSNANKYTPWGGFIHLKVKESMGWVIAIVADNGPGIPPEEQAQIFDPFFRRSVHEQDTEVSGSGLGLPIARSLAELHGGHLWVESQPGVGSSFFLKLPRHQS